MHQYKIVAQISLTLLFLNIVLIAPVVVCEIPEAHGDVMPKKWRELQAASARLTSPRSPPDVLGYSQHSSQSDGSTSSGYPSPYLSSDESISGYSWLLDRPPRLNLPLPAPSQGSASPHPPGQPDEPAPPHPPGLLDVPAPTRYLWDDWTPIPSYSASDGFTPSHELESSEPHSPTNIWWWLPYSPASTDFASASDGSLPSQYFSASDGSLHSHTGNGISEVSASTHSSPVTMTVPERDKFFNKDMVRNLKFLAGVTIITGAIVGIANSPIVHHNRQDS